MDDEAVARLADTISERVFTSMSKFVEVLEGVVRENEQLRAKVEHLELLMFGFGPEDEDDAHDDDCDCDLDIDEMNDFFDSDSVWEPEEDDSDIEPTFD